MVRTRPSAADLSIHPFIRPSVLPFVQPFHPARPEPSRPEGEQRGRRYLQATEGLGGGLAAGDLGRGGLRGRGGSRGLLAGVPARGQTLLQRTQLPTGVLHVLAQPVAQLQQPVREHVHLVPGREARRFGRRRVAPRAQEPGGGGAQHQGRSGCRRTEHPSGRAARGRADAGEHEM